MLLQKSKTKNYLRIKKSIKPNNYKEESIHERMAKERPIVKIII